MTDQTTQNEQPNVEETGSQPVQQETVQPAQEVQEAPQEVPQEQPVPEPAPQGGRGADENTIFIGRKSTMGYVLAVVTQFNSGASNVKVKARGKLISKAVDVVEITRGRFLPDLKKDDILIKTEEVQNEDGSKSKISSIEITLKK